MLKYIVFFKSTKRFIAGVKYKISAENFKSYLVGSRSKIPINKSREGEDYCTGYSMIGNENTKDDECNRKGVLV